MKKLLFILLGTFTFQFSNAQAPINIPDNIASGNCLDFDGVANYVGSIGSLSSYSFVQNTGVFTIEAWVQFDEVNVAKNYAIASTSSSGQWKGFSFFYSGGAGEQNLRFSGFRGGGAGPSSSYTIINGASYPFTAYSADGVIQDNDWHHVAITGDGTNVLFYVDGVASVGDGTITQYASGSATNPMSIGAWDNPFVSWTAFTDGQIDEVRIWNTTRTAGQIEDNMCKTLMGNEAGLVGYWNMNEGTGSIITDLTSNGNDGTLN